MRRPPPSRHGHGGLSRSRPPSREPEMAATHVRHELAHRASYGLSVSFYRDSVGDVLTLVVIDEQEGDHFVLGVPKARALDAFRHPYAYRALADADRLG